MANKLKITMKRSFIGQTQGQRGTLKSLGLRKRHQSVVRIESASLRGQLDKVAHLVDVETVSE